MSSGKSKDVRADLPPGLVGNTVGRAAMHAVRVERTNVRGTRSSAWRRSHQRLSSSGRDSQEPLLFIEPVYNIAPSPGEPAAFMFVAPFVPVRLDTSVLSDGDYAVRVTASDLTEADPILATTVTIWGVPADHEGPGPVRGQYGVAGGLGGPAAMYRVCRC